jgi:hypothetical protein
MDITDDANTNSYNKLTINNCDTENATSTEQLP